MRPSISQARRTVGRALAALTVAIGALSLAGCGPDQVRGMRLFAVAGQVRVNGRPLTTGAVSFRPFGIEGEARKHNPTGEIDAGGNYRLYTAGHSGAPAGRYKVLVFADENRLATSGAHPLMPKWLVNAKYTREQTTDVIIEVVESPPPQAYDLNLDR
jgi:hypothetical protein